MSVIGQTSTGTIFIGGTSSELDTTALIEAAVAQKTARAETLMDEVDANTEIVAAYSELLDLTSAIDDALNALRGKESLYDDTERVWDYKSGAATTSDGTDYSTIMDISIDSSAAIGSYEFEVISVATVHRVAGSAVADASAALGYTGSFDIGLSGGTSAQIDVTSGMSLQDVVDAINAEVGTTGVQASLVKTGEGEFKMVLTGTETNQDIVTSVVSGTDVLNSLGVTDGVGGFNDVLQASGGSEIVYNGVTITRDDNLYDDLIDGVTLDLNKAAVGTVVTLDVTNDVESAKDAILNFIDTYNAFREFVVQNRQISDAGEVDSAAVLFGDNLLDGVASTYTDLIGDLFNSNGVIETIRDLGITIGDDNMLELSDESALDDALLYHYDDVVAAFAASAESDNTEFALTRNNGITPTQDIVFDLTTDGAGTITGVTANGDSAAFTINGNILVGAVGTEYEGMQFTYVGTDASVTINVSFNQGLADKLINGVKGYTDSVTGLIIQEQASLQEANDEKEAEAADIYSRAASYEEAQIAKYAEMEAKLESLQLLKNQILAIIGANNDQNN